jgi:hypothetical protein
MRITIGVDIGQKRDPTAIAVAEVDRRQRPDGREDTHFLIRHLDRLPLGTAYPAVVERVAGVARAAWRRSREGLIVYVDATGVGQPVVDLLQQSQLPGRLLAVYFTHGDRRAADHREVKLGKAFLVSRLQALLQTHRIHLPKIPEAEVLARELLDFEIRVDEDARDRYGAFKVGTHDDLVTALGLAVQDDAHPTSGVVQGFFG